MQLITGSDWIIDIGPGAGDEGGRIIAQGPPERVVHVKQSKTAPYLTAWLSHQSTEPDH
jgi:excinuclease ABC subunit A